MDLELRKLFLDEAGTDEAENSDDDLLSEDEFGDVGTADEEDGDEAV